MSEEEHEALMNIVAAATEVIARWEHGDLAEAVRSLDACLREYDDAREARIAREEES